MQAPPLAVPFCPTRKPQPKLQQQKRLYNTLWLFVMGGVKRAFVVLR